MFVISLAWLQATAWSNPSMGNLNVTIPPTVSGPVGVPLNGSASFAVTITPGNMDPVTVALSTTSGTGSATFADGTTSATLYESQNLTAMGKVVSSTANNITISTSIRGNPFGSAQFSVVSVAISLNIASPVESTESSQWGTFTGQVGGSNPGLGAEIYYNGSPQPSSCVVGVELVGTVTPSNYAGPVTLQRSIVGDAAFLGQVSYQDPNLRPPGPEFTAGSLLNNIVGSGAPSDVFSLDAPGTGPGQSPSAPERFRVNFSEYAVLGDQNAQGPQVGAAFPYYVAVSCGGTSSAPALDTTYVANGDNAAKAGTVPLTYDLIQH
jgi:hypothetical protein